MYLTHLKVRLSHARCVQDIGQDIIRVCTERTEAYHPSTGRRTTCTNDTALQTWFVYTGIYIFLSSGARLGRPIARSETSG